jgi:hypothetical protein
MTTTFVLNIDKDLAEFVRHQNKTPVVDPSAFIARLVREDMKRNGATVQPAAQAKVDNNTTSQAMEEHIDDVIPAAG